MSWRWITTKVLPRDAVRQQRLLEDLARSTSFVADADDLHGAICGRIHEIAGCESVVFCEYQPSREAFVASYGPELDEASASQVVFGSGSRLAKWLRVNEEPLPVPDSRGVYEYLVPEERDMLRGLQVRLCLPLVAVNRLVGILLLLDRDPQWRVSSDTLDFLMVCSRQAALACERVNLQRAERDRIRRAGLARQLAVAGELAMAVAHEVRNPLQIMRSTVQHAIDVEAEPERLDEVREILMEEIDRIDGTVSRLLRLSRPRELQTSEIDLVEVAERSVKVLEAHAEHERVTIGFNFDCRPLPVLGDPNELSQVFLNVMLNACQAMPAGGRIDVLSTLLADDPLADDGVPFGVIEVRDDGPGIDQATLTRIFDPFFTTKKTGTGLGLPICLDIMTRHGGSIRLESQKGYGTTAVIAMPLRTALWPES